MLLSAGPLTGPRGHSTRAIFLCGVIGAAGCAHHAPSAAARPGALASGRAAFDFLLDPSAPSIGLTPGEALDPPRARGKLAPPGYPERALAAGFGAATVAVRIVIDEAGLVARVLDSPRMASSSGPFAEDFRRAVEDAVRTWRFDPGSARRTREGNDVDGDGKADYRIVESLRLVAVYYDVRFDFEIVDGQGRATTGSPPQ